MTGARSGPRRWPLAALIAAALFMRLLVPAGWMPAGHGLGIMPCPGEVAAPVMHGMAMGKGHGREHAPAAERKVCPFAVAALPILDPPPAVLPVPPLAAAPFLAAIRIAVAVGRGLAAPPPPARGPPLPA